MQIVVVNGSPHGARGSTAALTRSLTEAAGAAGAQIEEVYLNHDRVLPCTACETCHRTGRCPQADGFDAIRRRIEQADGLVLASPNHIFNVSGQLKVFMDRCSGVIHRVGFRGMYGALVVTAGGGEEAEVAAYMDRFLRVTGIVPVGAVWATMGGREPGDLPASAQDKARQVGERLVAAIDQRQSFPEVETWIDQFAEQMRALVNGRGDDWDYEQRYWNTIQGGGPRE